MNTQDQKDRASKWKFGGLTWRELGRRIWPEIYESDLFTRAAALSYYFLLALFPLLLFLTALLGYFAKAGTELRKNLLSYLGRVVPRSASELIDTTKLTRSATMPAVASFRSDCWQPSGSLPMAWEPLARP